MRLYKFFGFNWKESQEGKKSYSLDSLKGSYLYCSQKDQLNDPFEFRANYKAQVSNLESERRIQKKEIIRVIKDIRRNKIRLGYSLDGLPSIGELKKLSTRQEIQVHADALSIMLGETTLDAVSENRVCCLSESIDEQLMWGHYADGMRGFCLEFDFDTKGFKENFRKVRYSNKYTTYNTWPQIFGFAKGSSHDKEIIEELVKTHTTKPLEWKYEREVRYITDKSRIDYLNHEIKSISIGVKANREDVEALLESVNKSGNSVEYYVAHPSDTEYKILFSGPMNEKEIINFFTI